MLHAKSARRSHQAHDQSQPVLYLINMIDICVRNEAAMFQETASDIPVKSVPEMPNGERLGYENHKNSIMGRTEGALQSQKSNKPGLRFQRNRSFRSSDSQPNSNRASEDPATPMPPVVSMLKTIAEAIIHLFDLAPPDLCASVGKTRSDHRNRDRDRSSDSWPIARNDEPDQHAKDGIGKSERRDHGPKEASRAQDSWTNNGNKLRCFRRKYNNVDVSASDRSGPSAEEKAPSVISHAATWEEIEEIEEVMIQQNVQMTPVTEPTNRGAPPVPTMPLPGNLTLEEWGSNLISFGRKHKGKSFEAVMRQDPGYFSLEPSSIFEPDAGATGLCPVRTTMDVEGRSMMSSPEAQQFHAEVLAARKDLQTEVTDKTNSPNFLINSNNLSTTWKIP